ncbi:hypothetical protein H4K36_00110 [Streptomyces sp. DHE7-1]|nr:hypothetical protein [Streptomyces sp. DHE7-1]
MQADTKRNEDTVTKSEARRLQAVVNHQLGPDGYELAEAHSVSGYPVYEARMLPARLTKRPAPLAVAPSAPSGEGVYAAVRRAARGERKDYACPREPVPDGGQADVFQAIHKPTGTTVALKKLHSKYPAERQVARMRREIEIGQLLNSHPHAMPILDFGADHTWFVMPWAEATAAQRQEVLRDPAELRALVAALASVLATAHEDGWLHRDIKPSNILFFDGRWTLADWASSAGHEARPPRRAAPATSSAPRGSPPRNCPQRRTRPRRPATSTASAESSPGPSPAHCRRPTCRSCPSRPVAHHRPRRHPPGSATPPPDRQRPPRPDRPRTRGHPRRPLPGSPYAARSRRQRRFGRRRHSADPGG